MNAPRLAAVLFLASCTLACDGEPGSDAQPESTAENVTESVAEIAERGDESSAVMEGEVAFTVDGKGYSFDHVVADETYSLPIVTSAWLGPEPGATERFGLIINGMDLDDYAYPTTLPPEEAGMSVATAGMGIAFHFIAPDGQRWAATGDLEVESFQEDVLVASFDELELFDSDSMEPGPTMNEGRIRVEF